MSQPQDLGTLYMIIYSRDSVSSTAAPDARFTTVFPSWFRLPHSLSSRVPPFSIHSRSPISGSRFGLVPPLSVMNKLTTPLDVNLPIVTCKLDRHLTMCLRRRQAKPWASTINTDLTNWLLVWGIATVSGGQRKYPAGDKKIDNHL